ncbi:RraA family protein [Bacteroides intestinalis]|uniref:RraA family protein n=1 Tax=Bacteroides intestinalis TaxID=329854 RepID=UPI00189DB048|nr:RraA family protein [Bacteroides intestinalis]
MESIVTEAISLIEANKISSTEVGDVLGKKGQIEGVHALNKGMFRTGEVAFIYAINNSNYEVHRQLAEKDIKGKILFVYNVNCDKAIFGDLVTKYIMLYKQARAIVVTGKLRDAHTLIKEQYPIWLEDVSPIGCVNKQNGEDLDVEEYERLKAIYEGAVMVCDDSGVVMIPKEKITGQLLTKLNFIEFQEDIWFYCLDTLKMSTFDIVCRKKYLDGELLDRKLLDKLEEFQKNI